MLSGGCLSVVRLSGYNNRNYKPCGKLYAILWLLVNIVFFKNPFPIPYKLKAAILKIFGCKIGSNAVIKPSVSIKYPKLLTIGDNVWVGEGVWIDNLADVTIGNNVCISQDAYLLTGSHDYKKTSFDLIVKPIVIEDGVWVGAKSVVCPGVRCGTHSVLSVCSVAVSDMEPYSIYQGNPAIFKRVREIKS